MAFRVRLIESYGLDEVNHDYITRLRERVFDLMALPTHAWWIAEDGAPIAMIGASLELALPGPNWSGVTGVLSTLWVEPAARHGGVARALMGTACDWCRAQGARRVQLHASPIAVGFYQKLGFEITGQRQEHFTSMWASLDEG